MKESAVEGIEP